MVCSHSDAGRAATAARHDDSFGQTGNSRQSGPEASGGRASVSGDHRLRRYGRSAARQRRPLTPQLHSARPPRPGEKPDSSRPRRFARRRRFPSCPAAKFTTIRSSPICGACRARVAAEGDQMPIGWLPREARFVEKLATPDVTIADMVGDIDPIKAAQAGLNLADELTMHYGLLPRANRGIFAINELPDLAGKIQVGLFNILQEGDVQIKGYPIRLKLDVLLVFTANPEDYTARGKIITPLKDRIGSEIRTHYPATRDNAIAITAQEAWTDRESAASGGAGMSRDSRVRARGRGRGRVPGARGSQDRQAIRRQPAPAHHDARAGRVECGAARARGGRDASWCRASPTSTPRCRQSPANSSSSTKGNSAAPNRWRADLIRSVGRLGLHRHVRRRRHAVGGRVVRSRRLVAAERRHGRPKTW